MSNNYYLFKSGTLSRKNNSLLFKLKSGDNKFIPINDVNDIYIFNKVNFNSDLITFLFDISVNLHIFDYYNNYKGTFLCANGVNSGNVLVKQVEKYNNNRVYISRKILESAKFNISKNLIKHNISIDKLSEYDLTKCDNINSLMGVEGNIRKYYYNNFKNITKRYKMNGRNKRPPRDEINCMISFGNMLCYTECIRAINKTSLSVNISFLHELKDSRKSLSLDISEILKPVLVDRVIFNLINNNIIRDEHFTKDVGICHLNNAGKKIFVKEWDDKLKVTIYNKKLKRNISYRELFKFETYKLLKYIIEDVEYEPLKIWW